MYGYIWHKSSRGYKLTLQNQSFTAMEIRPVFANELTLLGTNNILHFDPNEPQPFMWAKNNTFFYQGEKLLELHKVQIGKPLDIEYFTRKRSPINAVNIDMMVEINKRILNAIVADTTKRIREMYELYKDSCDLIYIAFSGGKDSVVLLDLCHQVLPLSVPIVFSDTHMELPDTYTIMKVIEKQYKGRQFIVASSEIPAITNWQIFGPPSRTIRWCCSVHKSTPTLLALKDSLKKSAARVMAFIGVRGEESISRSSYDDIGIGVKNFSQINAMPLLSWGAHEIYLYILSKKLPLHDAYRYGLPRVGCIMCPEASDKYAWYVNAAYPGIIDPFITTIRESCAKTFTSEQDELNFLAQSGWQARKSGITLKSFIARPAELVSSERLEWAVDSFFSESAYLEWLKIIGKVERTDFKNQFIVHCEGVARKYADTITVTIDTGKNQQKRICCIVENMISPKAIQMILRKIVNKSIACVACKTCEVECPTGALTFRKRKNFINIANCRHCLQCLSPEEGCWRFTSMEVSNEYNSTLAGIDRYKHFGFKQEWLSMYIIEKEALLTSGKLGTNMIPAARNWFLHSFLSSGKSDKPTSLLQIAEKFGADSSFVWDILWIGMAQRSAIVRWYVTHCDVGKRYSIDDLITLLGNVKSSTKGGGLDSLKATFKASPLGTGSSPLVQLEMKGSRVLSLRRVPHSVPALVILYSLYIMGQVSGRDSFTLSEMMSTTFESSFISPLTAFGMSTEELKTQCLGLSTKYPRYISCSFTLGLDEIRIFPTDYGMDDIINLLLDQQ